MEVSYVLYTNGRARLVSREEWESSWLEYWKRANWGENPKKIYTGHLDGIPSKSKSRS